MFLEARMVSTPLVVIRTHDPFATSKAVAASFGEKKDSLPFLSWDAIRGLQGLTDAGASVLVDMLKPTETQPAETVDLSVALGVLAAASENVIAFIFNPHLVWDADKKVVQGISNLRDDYKANGNMAVFIVGVGDDLPSEIGQDVLVLEVPLPTRDQLSAIVKNMYAYAGEEKKFSACKKGPSQEVIERAVDAGIGIPSFPFEQATSICLDKVTGILDIDAMWGRKREIVTQNPGLTYHPASETLKDMAGCASWIKSAQLLMNGPHKPTIIVRMDEIQRQFAGNETDSSGTKGNLMGEFLNWVNDRKVICSLNLGVSGTSKSWGAYCIGGEYGKPVLEYNLAAMEHEHVGKSAKHMRNANRCLDAIGDGKIWLIATANKLNGLPPELISRFQLGGIYFFDMPTIEEQQGILKIKIAAYSINPDQEIPKMVGWTGRDIDNCCRKAQLFGASLVESSKYVVPLHESHHEEIEAIRMAASGRFLSASTAGVYHYTPSPIKHEPTAKIVEGRKFRTE
jgi:hypothetical protein